MITGSNHLLTNWVARKNSDNTVCVVTIFISGTNQVRLITKEIIFILNDLG